MGEGFGGVDECEDGYPPRLLSPLTCGKVRPGWVWELDPGWPKADMTEGRKDVGTKNHYKRSRLKDRKAKGRFGRTKRAQNTTTTDNDNRQRA